ncbi:hypothetical protein JW835_12380 [bacterium]|nr:hypothetical protein [bacterium]
MSWYPDPEQRGDIQFVFMKSWPYNIRMAVIMIIMFFGILVQLFVNFWAGLVFLFSGTLLGIIRGYHSKPVIKRGETWNRVTPDELKKVIEKEKQLKSWDRDAFDITNKTGCLIFFLLIIAFIFLFGMIGRWISFKLAVYVCINAVVVIAPHWFTGVRTYLKQDTLILKIHLLQAIMKVLEANSEIQVHPMLSVQKTKKNRQVPKDARLMIRMIQAPEDFLGIQVQVAINTVQGTKYPYLYCVLLAQEKAGLLNQKRSIISPSPKVVLSQSHSEGVDVLVVRQKTSKNSGYHTNDKAAIHVVDSALNLARDLLGGKAS